MHLNLDDDEDEVDDEEADEVEEKLLCLLLYLLVGFFEWSDEFEEEEEDDEGDLLFFLSCFGCDMKTFSSIFMALFIFPERRLYHLRLELPRQSRQVYKISK